MHVALIAYGAALVAECAPEFVRKACNELGSSEGSVEADGGAVGKQ